MPPPSPVDSFRHAVPRVLGALLLALLPFAAPSQGLLTATPTAQTVVQSDQARAEVLRRVLASVIERCVVARVTARAEQTSRRLNNIQRRGHNRNILINRTAGTRNMGQAETVYDAV